VKQKVLHRFNATGFVFAALLLLSSLAFSGTAGFGSTTAQVAHEHVPMVQQPI
jgi:hypothetical protein